MRVLSVSNFYDTHGGGLERVAGHLNREFVAAGHTAIWAASDADGLPNSPAELIGLRCANPTETLTGLPMPIPWPRSVRALSRAVSTSDVVVIHDALYVTSIWAMIFAKRHRKPVVLIQHIGSIPFASGVMRAIMQIANVIVTRPMMSAADRLVFISNTVRDELMGSPPHRESRLVFNGVEHGVFNTSASNSRKATRLRWKLPENGILVIFVGRFVEKKGLSVIQALAKQRPDVHFALVGSGPIQPELWQLQNVHVLGQQPQEIVADLFRASDLLLLPSVGEGFPLVVQEAMACGLPVICGEVSARADPAASRWLHGIEVDLKSPEESATRCGAAVSVLQVEPVDTNAMAEYAAKTYDWRVMAKAILDGMG